MRIRHPGESSEKIKSNVDKEVSDKLRDMKPEAIECYQTILENLSELEEAFYYASDAEDRLNMTYEEMHDLMEKALVLWGKYTGCKLGGEDSREL